MLRIYCSQCGGTVSIQENQRVALCDHCGNTVPVPRGYTKLESSFNYAMEARLRRDFAAAQAAYSEIVKAHPDSAAAYWGRALSRYEVEYQPINEIEYRLVCHQAELRDFAADADVQKALDLAQGEEKASYQEECGRIAALQVEVSAHAAVTAPYDVVIAVDENNPAALEHARAIRTGATAAGLRCLCPALDLQQTPRQDWEPVLYHGLNTAGAMVYVAVGRNAFPPDAKFDAERYLSLKAKSLRAASRKIQRLILAFSGLNEYEDIPDSLFDGADERVSMEGPEFVAKVCNLLTEKGYGDALRTENAGHENYKYTNLIRQARLSLDGGDFQAAEDAYNQILNYNPRESQAYWGLLLAKNHCKNEDALIQLGTLVWEDGSYKSAVAFANEREAQTYQSVAEASEKMYKVHQEQAAEHARKREEQEQLRARKEKEVQEAFETRKRKKAKARKRSIAIFLILAILLAAGCFLFYRQKQADDAIEETYQQAMSYYNGGDFSSAQALFEELGDYKDSAAMYDRCTEDQKQKSFYQAQFNGESLETRASAVRTMLSLVDEFPEAQDYLDQWLQEGEEYYAQGKYAKAMLALKGFGQASQAYIEVWRTYQSQGLVSISDGGTILAISASDGSLMAYNCEHLNIEEGSYKSVSLSDSGKSAALVRSDGTAYLTGAVADTADISGWTGLRCIQTTDEVVVGLMTDGTLLSSKAGVLASDVKQFDLTDGQVAAVRNDGTVYCTHEPTQEILSQVTDAAYVALSWSSLPLNDYSFQVYIVDHSNRLTVMRCSKDMGNGEIDTDFPTNSIVAAISDSGCVGVLSTGGNVYSSGWASQSSVAFNNTFLVDFSDLMDLRILSDGTGYGLNGMEEAEIAIRKQINALEGVGMPE